MADKNDKKNISKGKKIKFALFTLLFLAVIILLLSEVVLYFMKYPSSYDKMQKVSYTQAKWWTCDSVSGPRYVAHQATLQGAFDVQLLHGAVRDDGHPRLLRGPVDQDVLAGHRQSLVPAATFPTAAAAPARATAAVRSHAAAGPSRPNSCPRSGG